MKVTMKYGEHSAQAPLTADELETWQKVFRSTFGPKQAFVDELRSEQQCDAVVVQWDGCTAEFRADGTMREWGADYYDELTVISELAEVMDDQRKANGHKQMRRGTQ